MVNGDPIPVHAGELLRPSWAHARTTDGVRVLEDVVGGRLAINYPRWLEGSLLTTLGWPGILGRVRGTMMLIRPPDGRSSQGVELDQQTVAITQVPTPTPDLIVVMIVDLPPNHADREYQIIVILVDEDGHAVRAPDGHNVVARQVRLSSDLSGGSERLVLGRDANCQGRASAWGDPARARPQLLLPRGGRRSADGSLALEVHRRALNLDRR